jgi:hypothetical protein
MVTAPLPASPAICAPQRKSPRQQSSPSGRREYRMGSPLSKGSHRRHLTLDACSYIVLFACGFSRPQT